MRAILVCPHYDDEILLTGSFLVEYEGDVTLIVTHQGDCIPPSKWEVENNAFTNVVREIQDYRSQKGKGKLKIVDLSSWEPDCLGYSTRPESYIGVLSQIEKEVLEGEEISYFIFPAKSGHQNHNECNKMCRSVLRDRYTDRIKTIMESVYPNMLFSPTAEGIDLSSLNAFHEVSSEGMELLKRQLDVNYNCKVQGNLSYNGASYEIVCRYFGRNARIEFAQPYILKSTKL